MSEICKLQPHDLRHLDGIWILNIKRGEGRTTKRPVSVRIVPVHDELVRLAPETAERFPGLPGGLIEILLPGGVSLRVDAQVDGSAQQRVLRALEGR